MRAFAPADCPDRRAVLASVPLALLYLVGYLLLRPLVTVRVKSPPKLPDRALVYAFHEVLLLGVLGAKATRGIVWVSGDTAGGMAAALPATIAGIRVFRPRTSSPVPRTEQLSAFLKVEPGPVGIFTGGRRNRNARASPAQLALTSDRPLVPMKATTSRSTCLNGQLLPLPFAVVTIEFGTAIRTDVLATMEQKEIQRLLNRRLGWDREA